MFDFVLNDTVGVKPIVFPPETDISDGLVYDPEANVLYYPPTDDHRGEYEYRWARDKWVSNVDVFSLGKADRSFVLITGDIMTGPLKMSDDIQEDPAVTGMIFKPKKIALEENQKLPAQKIILIKSHTIVGEQKVGQRLAVGTNSKIINGNNIRYITNWYRLKPEDWNWMDYTTDIDGNKIYSGIVNVPSDTDWAKMSLVKNNSTSYNLEMEDYHCYFRTEQICTELNPSPGENPPDVTSQVDTYLVVLPWGSQPKPE